MQHVELRAKFPNAQVKYAWWVIMWSYHATAFWLVIVARVRFSWFFTYIFVQNQLLFESETLFGYECLFFCIIYDKKKTTQKWEWSLLNTVLPGAISVVWIIKVEGWREEKRLLLWLNYTSRSFVVSIPSSKGVVILTWGNIVMTTDVRGWESIKLFLVSVPRIYLVWFLLKNIREKDLEWSKGY